MERKKGIDHEQVGTDVSRREDERQDITNIPAERAAPGSAPRSKRDAGAAPERDARAAPERDAAPEEDEA